MQVLDRVFSDPNRPYDKRLMSADGKPGGGSAVETNRLKAAAAAQAPNHPSKTIQIGRLTINIFEDEKPLNHYVAQQIINEIKKPGLIIFPSDSTHGDEQGRAPGRIYNYVNEAIKDGNLAVHNNMRATHMDELDLSSATGEKALSDSDKFASSLRGWLPNLMNILDPGHGFHSIDASSLDAYNDFVNGDGGPRVIIGGVGAEVPPHIAYIGEEQEDGQPILNQETRRVKLRDGEKTRRGVTHAVTMGMRLFESPNLEKVIITAKGEHKAPSILYALKEALNDETPNGNSALGKILKDYVQNEGKDAQGKLILNLDQEAYNDALSTKNGFNPTWLHGLTLPA